MSKLHLVCPKCKSIIGKFENGIVECAKKCRPCSLSFDTFEAVHNLRGDNETKQDIDQTAQSSLLPKQNSDNLNIPFIQEALNSGEFVLELGAGVDASLNPKLVKTDAFLYSSNLHCLADAHSLPFEDNTFGYVYSLAVFEHLHSPWIAAEEILRVLKPGGKVFTLTAFMQHMHGYPNHYFNMTTSGLERIFNSFEVIKCAPSMYSNITEIAYILCDLSLILRNYLSNNKSIKKEYADIQNSIKDFCTHISPINEHLMSQIKDNDLDFSKISPAIELIATKPF